MRHPWLSLLWTTMICGGSLATCSSGFHLALGRPGCVTMIPTIRDGVMTNDHVAAASMERRAQRTTRRWPS